VVYIQKEFNNALPALSKLVCPQSGVSLRRQDVLTICKCCTIGSNDVVTYSGMGSHASPYVGTHSIPSKASQGKAHGTCVVGNTHSCINVSKAAHPEPIAPIQIRIPSKAKEITHINRIANACDSAGMAKNMAFTIWRMFGKAVNKRNKRMRRKDAAKFSNWGDIAAQPRATTITSNHLQ
jgi:hypothetical protein